MKSRFFRILPAMAAALLLTACSQDELADGNGTSLPEGKYPLQIGNVSITADVDAQPWTRVSENDDRNSSHWDWNGTEVIGVQIEGSTKSGRYRLMETYTLSPEIPVYWENTQAHKVRAWYPADGNVALDNQTIDNGLAYALYAETAEAVDYKTEGITLPFVHALAKVRVKLEGDKKDDVTDVQIKTYTSCTLGADGTLTASGTEDFIPMVETTDNNGETCWEANVMPGQIIGEVKVNDKEITLSTSLAPLEAKMNTITLTVGKAVTEITGGETITEPGDYIMKGTITQSVTLNGDGIRLTLQDVNSTITYSAPIVVESGTPTIIVTGTNTLKDRGGTGRQGGILLKDNASIVIEGTGTLNVETDSSEGVGIGAQTDQHCGNITIKGITLTVKNSNSVTGSSNFAAGIGNSQTGTCGNIEIINATVNVTGTPAIGASTYGYDKTSKCGDIYIENSSITATGLIYAPGPDYSEVCAPAIGSGGQKSGGHSVCGTITIKNTNMTESEILSTLTAGGGSAQRIGKGESTNENGSVTCGTVTIISKDGTKEYPDGID